MPQIQQESNLNPTLVNQAHLPSRIAVRTPRFLLRSTVRWYLVRYAFFVMVRVQYDGTLFELKIPDFSHFAPDFCMQKQKTAEADAQCVN